MIWLWLRDLLAWLARLVVPPPRRYRSHIDPNSPCPACGNVGSKLEFQRVEITNSGNPVTVCMNCGSTSIGKAGSELHCNQCGAQITRDGMRSAAMVRKECSVCKFAHYIEPVSTPRYPAM